MERSNAVLAVGVCDAVQNPPTCEPLHDQEYRYIPSNHRTSEKLPTTCVHGHNPGVVCVIRVNWDPVVAPGVHNPGSACIFF